MDLNPLSPGGKMKPSKHRRVVIYLQSNRSSEEGFPLLLNIPCCRSGERNVVHFAGKTVAVALLSLILLVTALGQGRLSAGVSADELTNAIQSRLKTAEARNVTVSNGKVLSSPAELRKFYAHRGFRPAWIDQEGPWPIADSLLSALRKASRHGLHPEDYHLASIEDLFPGIKWPFFGRKSLSLEESTDFEFLLTDAFFLYASDLASGKMRGKKKKFQWFLRDRATPNLTETLDEALESGQIQPVLESLAPISPSYIRLRTALLKYQEIDRRGGWPVIPDGVGLKKGDRGKRVALLRKRLNISGDLSRQGDYEDSREADLFDDSLEQAVWAFQQRHGLIASGIVGSGTLEVLNVSAAQRVRQLEVNLERLRWMPEDLGDLLVLINIPEFRLRVLEDEKEVMSSRIVVGKYAQNTPVFDSRISHFILNPYWYVPRSIAIEEVLPLARKYPEYFNWENMKVLSSSKKGSTKIIPPWEIDWEKVTASNFRYQFRQDAGPKNPLGRIKFVFPNSFDVYLHDTPDRYLFDQAERNFSHGCIRLENTVDLAVTLLRGKSGTSKEQLISAMESGEMKSIRLPQAVEIDVLYFTAWVDADGAVQFRKDVYNYDAPLLNDLEKTAQGSETAKN
jgi:L,D-transpeptidase YcbB